MKTQEAFGNKEKLKGISEFFPSFFTQAWETDVATFICRDAKRESLSRQAYRFLTSLHENFSECYDKVFLIDKIQKEISELQETIESLEKRPIDLKKLQADIDCIVAENLSLQKG